MTGLSEAVSATACRDVPGRYLLRAASLLDPALPPPSLGEVETMKMTEISKMKGQGLTCERNAKLVTVNARYIAYAMKEGQVRVINQNGKDMYKLTNRTKAPIIALDLFGSNKNSTLFCLDSSGMISVFALEEAGGNGAEQRMRRLDLAFGNDSPLKIIAHPRDPHFFATLHHSRVAVWNLTKLEISPPPEEAAPPKIAEGRTGSAVTRVITDDSEERSSFASRGAFPCHSGISISSNESSKITLKTNAKIHSSEELIPSSSSSASPARSRDMALSLDGSFLVGLSSENLCVWRLCPEKIGDPQGLQLLQLMSLPSSETISPLSQRKLEPLSVRLIGPILPADSVPGGDPPLPAVLALGLGGGEELLFYSFSSSGVGPLVQSIRFASTSVADEAKDDLFEGILDTSSTGDILGFGLRKQGLVLTMPLAIGWTGSNGPPFPQLQRHVTKDPIHQLSMMAAKPAQGSSSTLFMYRAHNFVREKDHLSGCNIVVNEVNPKFIERPVAPPEDERPPPPPPLPTVTPETPRTLPVAEGTVEGPQEVPPVPREEFLLQRELLQYFSNSSGVPGKNGVHEDAHVLPSARAFLDFDPTVAAAAVTAEAADASPLPDSFTCSVASLCEEVKPAVFAEPASLIGEVERRGVIEPETQKANREGGTSLDWGLMRQLAASFVKSVENKRQQTAEKILAAVAEEVRSGVAMPQNGAGVTAADMKTLDEALAKVREAREVHFDNEKTLAANVKKASDGWAVSASVALAGVLQKELSNITDGVCTTLAQQLSQSRKFCEALARGVQRSGGAATKQALEALRPPKQLQETVGTALSEALHESLAPVFRSELRQHFEQELAPLISTRVSEMMSTFKDRMGECLDGIAAEHERAAKRLGADLAPIVAEELRQVQRAMTQLHDRSEPTINGGAAADFTEASLDEVVRTVQAEVITPLHARVKELTQQVQSLREEARRLDRRCNACGGAFAGTSSGTGENCVADGPPPPPPPPIDEEEAHAAELDQLFRKGSIQDAFIKAMHLQQRAKHTDFIGRLCHRVDIPVDEWLHTDDDASKCPLSMPVKMLLMLSLARQLENTQVGEFYRVADDQRASKADWLNDLWLAFDPKDQAVSRNAANLCSQLIEVLDKALASRAASGEIDGKNTTSDNLRQLARGVRASARLLSSIS